MLTGTRRRRDEVVAVLAPRLGQATVERAAVNAVLAGALPEYLPVVLAALEALADPVFNLQAVQTTTHPCSPLIIVNGPVAARLGMNATGNALGQGTRANAAIGRAVRLALLNLGGARPGREDRATQGIRASTATAWRRTRPNRPGRRSRSSGGSRRRTAP
jgi:hypothetical protein